MFPANSTVIPVIQFFYFSLLEILFANSIIWKPRVTMAVITWVNSFGSKSLYFVIFNNFEYFHCCKCVEIVDQRRTENLYSFSFRNLLSKNALSARFWQLNIISVRKCSMNPCRGPFELRTLFTYQAIWTLFENSESWTLW